MNCSINKDNMIYLIPIVNKNGKLTNEYKKVCRLEYEYSDSLVYVENSNKKENDNAKKED